MQAFSKAGLRALPTLVLETADGRVVLIRVERHDGKSAALRARSRPLTPYPPFSVGDDAPAPQSDKPAVQVEPVEQKDR